MPDHRPRLGPSLRFGPGGLLGELRRLPGAAVLERRQPVSGVEPLQAGSQNRLHGPLPRGAAMPGGGPGVHHRTEEEPWQKGPDRGGPTLLEPGVEKRGEGAVHEAQDLPYALPGNSARGDKPPAELGLHVDLS